MSSIVSDCGQYELEFFDYESGDQLDSSIFDDDRSGSPENALIVKAVEEDDYRYGSYKISFKITYAGYSSVSVNYENYFTVSVVDPCGDTDENSLTMPQP